MFSKKGFTQIDFLFVLLIVMLFLVYFFNIIDDDINLDKKNSKIKLMDIQTRTICSILANSPGTPDDWDITNVESFGLIRNNSIFVSQNKLNDFFNTSNYKKIFDSFNPDMILRFNLKSLDGSLIKSTGFFDNNSFFYVKNECYLNNGSQLLILEVEGWK